MKLRLNPPRQRVYPRRYWLPGATSTTTATATVSTVTFTRMFLGKRRAVGHHQIGIRSLTPQVAAASPAPPSGGDSILLESGDHLLLESGDRLLME